MPVIHLLGSFGPLCWEAIALQRVYLFAFFVLTMNGMSLYTPPDQLTSQAEKDDETLWICRFRKTLYIFFQVTLHHFDFFQMELGMTVVRSSIICLAASS